MLVNFFPGGISFARQLEKRDSEARATECVKKKAKTRVSGREKQQWAAGEKESEKREFARTVVGCRSKTTFDNFFGLPFFESSPAFSSFFPHHFHFRFVFLCSASGELSHGPRRGKRFPLFFRWRAFFFLFFFPPLLVKLCVEQQQK